MTEETAIPQKYQIPDGSLDAIIEEYRETIDIMNQVYLGLRGRGATPGEKAAQFAVTYFFTLIEGHYIDLTSRSKIAHPHKKDTGYIIDCSVRALSDFTGVGFRGLYKPKSEIPNDIPEEDRPAIARKLVEKLKAASFTDQNDSEWVYSMLTNGTEHDLPSAQCTSIPEYMGRLRGNKGLEMVNGPLKQEVIDYATRELKL